MDTRRAKAYLNSTSGTATKRHEVDAALSRAVAEPVSRWSLRREFRIADKRSKVRFQTKQRHIGICPRSSELFARIVCALAISSRYLALDASFSPCAPGLRRRKTGMK